MASGEELLVLQKIGLIECQQAVATFGDLLQGCLRMTEGKYLVAESLGVVGVAACPTEFV